MSKITRDVKTIIADIRALPDEVAIDLYIPEKYLTTDEAFTLAKMLKKAAKASRHLDWREKENGDLEVVARP